MYLNAFKDRNSTFLKDVDGSIFGNDLSERRPEEWGHIQVKNCKINRGLISIIEQKYIQLDDQNKEDASVLSISMSRSIKPGEQVEIQMDFVAKLPKTIVRAGYGRDDYYLFVHWFPQLGVLEPQSSGEWGWNCHQFFRQTEFFADFSSFNVTINCPKNLVLGATGCEVSKVSKGTNVEYQYHAKDVIDFAWVAYPYFEEYVDQWNHVDIQMLIPREHKDIAPRYLGAIKNALTYLEDHVGPYPYPKITIVDPPLHTLNSGFMEYPMLITCASFHYVPKGIRTIESLAIHEFTHQYFMGILASNEKEEAWLDEGFVSFFEDQIIDHYYGGRYNSLFDILGFQSTGKEQSRIQYVSISKPHSGPIARPGWEYESDYKPLIYDKTATMLQTLKGYVGDSLFFTIIRQYYQDNKFSHPKEADWIDAVRKVCGDYIGKLSVQSFFQDVLHTSKYVDYAVESVSNEHNSTTIHIKNKGNLNLPVDIKIQNNLGQIIYIPWVSSSADTLLRLSYPVTYVHIDPDYKNQLDLNLNNNSWAIENNHISINHYYYKVASWFHLAIQYVLG
jgi:hypothetical protein